MKFRESVFVEAIKSIKSIDLGNYLGNLHYLSSTSYGVGFIKIWEPRGRDPPVLSQSLGEMRHIEREQERETEKKRDNVKSREREEEKDNEDSLDEEAIEVDEDEEGGEGDAVEEEVQDR